jgi:hypothetical protein
MSHTDEQPLQPDISELKDYQPWYQEGHDLFTYASTILTPDLAIASTKLFWPDFVVYRDCIFLGASMSDRSKGIADDWITQLKANLTAVERVMNHQHVGEDLMREPFESLGYANVAYFAQILMKTWGAALRDQFPDRECVVEGWKEGSEEEGYQDYTITFFQKRIQA